MSDCCDVKNINGMNCHEFGCIEAKTWVCKACGDVKPWRVKECDCECDTWDNEVSVVEYFESMGDR